MITVHANAKINLTLEVLGRREDGYHEIATVLQEIDLKDTLTFEEYDKLVLDCDVPYLNSPQNIVHRAAKLIQEELGLERGVSIGVQKGIPIAAGLGGGASDAVATLRTIGELWGLDISSEQLLRLANKLGSDTAFFIHGGTALGEGRGEILTNLPSLSPSWVVLLKPPVDIPRNKTKTLYASIEQTHFSDGWHTDRVVEALREKGSVSPSLFFNTFEQAAARIYIGLEQHWQRFVDLGAGDVHLSGSGPTLFSLARDRGHAEELYNSLVAQGLEAYLVQTVARH
jgi:4-diphosphocytidyl-2-C-methyl-D-erythritol kinase